MPRYNVHLYTVYRVMFEGIEAATAEEAAEKANDMPHREAKEIEWAESPPSEALVDTVEIDKNGVPTGEINIATEGDAITMEFLADGKARRLDLSSAP